MLNYDDGQFKAAIQPKRATFGDVLKRDQMIRSAKPQGGEDESACFARVIVEATLKYGTASAEIEQDGLTLSNVIGAHLLDLPAALVDAWILAVYEINPTWNPAHREDVEAREKKASMSIDA